MAKITLKDRILTCSITPDEFIGMNIMPNGALRWGGHFVSAAATQKLLTMDRYKEYIQGASMVKTTFVEGTFIVTFVLQ